MKPRWPIAISLLVAGTAFAFLTAGRIGENLVYYWSPSDLTRAGNKAYGASTRLGFDGRRLMVSHNNDYRAPKKHGQVAAEELIRSTKGVSD